MGINQRELVKGVVAQNSAAFQVGGKIRNTASVESGSGSVGCELART